MNDAQDNNPSHVVPSTTQANSSIKRINRRGRRRVKKSVTKEQHQDDGGEAVSSNHDMVNNTQDIPAHDTSTPNKNTPQNREKQGTKGSNLKWSGKTNKKKKQPMNQKFPWRKEIPEGTVDPISLEPLKKLSYPPFALKITPPYHPIPEWPIVADGEHDSTKEQSSQAAGVEKDPREREQQIISEQWGHLLLSKNKQNEDMVRDETKKNESMDESSKLQSRHVHLYDGRVLALYLVSTLQFIDPLNRRDLTREEIQNLDAYLAKHRLKKLKVLDAYDERGISLSTAGASAQTPSGRLQIRQEEARNILNSIFSHGHHTATNDSARDGNRSRRRGREGQRDNANVSRERGASHLYAAYQATDQVGDTQASNTTSYPNHGPWGDHDFGIYADDHGGLLVIDDDLNPGLRGGLSRATVQSNTRSTANLTANDNHMEPLVSSNVAQMASWYGHRARVHADSFPALPPPSSLGSETSAVTSLDAAQDSGDQQIGSTKPAKLSKSLSKISKLVQKTDPKQLEKQRRARELALRKAALASIPFEEAVRRMEIGHSSNDISSQMQGDGLLPVPSLAGHSEPTQGQLVRNQNLASALGVAPSTLRSKLNSGWSRPTDIPRSIDEFGNELNTTQYPDSLIIEARERMTQLLRLEKKWLTFLRDDKAASCPLKPMDKATRKFVHEYSDFWNMHTQSFDPEPIRYIHCVKLTETRAPRPLLSDAVHAWRGPMPKSAAAVTAATVPAKETSASMEQAAGEETMSSSREFVRTEKRAPLRLEPRSFPSGVVPPPGAMFDLDVCTTHVPEADQVPQPAQRFAALLAERERPKLNLQPRTKPLELPKYQPPQKLNYSDISNMNEANLVAEKERRKLQEEKTKSILAAAFASDDEESDSDWDAGEPLVQISSDEEEY